MALAMLAAVCAVAFVGFVVVMTAVKVLLRLVLLPLLLLKLVFLGIVFTVVGPILFVVGILVAFVVGAAVLAPLLPLLAVGFLVWLLLRGNRQRALVPSR